jgi:transcriptional regulator|tara:strand:- start:6234 stop:6608 length:375 start_codon:yes stop_codon:yes gene_type:complete
MFKIEDITPTREVELQNAKLHKLLEEKIKLVEEGKSFQKKVEKLQKEQRKIGLKLNKVKEKVLPLIAEESTKLDIGQFEAPMNVNIIDGKSILTIVDRVEDFKKRLLEKLEEDNKKDAKETETE